MFSTNRITIAAWVIVTASVIAGCGTSSSSPNTTAALSADGARYRLKAEPAGAKGVKQVRGDSKDDDEIIVVGRIGGDANPWIEGQAAFLVVDTELKPCSSEEGCPTPWDYCCDSNSLPENKAMVKVIGEDGKPVAVDARKLLGVKELQTVVVHGRARRDESGNLTVLADGVYVRN